MLQRTHVLVSLVLGVILILSAASGLVLSGNTLVEHLRAAPSQGETVAVVAERIARQLPGIERIERAPSGELRVAFSTVLLAAAAGAVYVLNLALYLQAVPLVGSGPATAFAMTAPLWVVIIGAIEIVLALGVFVLVRRGRFGDVRAAAPIAPRAPPPPRPRPLFFRSGVAG